MTPAAAATAPSFDLAAVRARFPALGATGDAAMVYMDNAGGSAVLATVADRVARYLVSTNVQLGASYATSRESGRLVDAGVAAAQVFVNAAAAEEVVMGSSTTQLVENLARAMEAKIEPHHEIIITNTDHEANAGPWARLAERKNLKLHVWNANPDTFELELKDLEALMNENTRLVAVTHCSNILGTVNDVEEIAKVVHRVPGAEICVDGVAYAPHRAIDVQKFDVDYYVFSWYKVFGPHISLLYIARRTTARLTSLAHYFIPSDAAHRPYIYQPGGVNYELTASLPAVAEYVAWLGVGSAPSGLPLRQQIEAGYAAIEAAETAVAAPLLAFLRSRPDVFTVVGRPGEPGPTRVPTVAFLVKGMKSEEVVLAVDEERIGIRFGHFVTHRLIVQSMGLTDDGIVRVSLVHYNTPEEVERLIKILGKVCL
ncbi:cysteine desulfurase family protein [Zopfochytrium polystomum]|nr:cysteine desulfurase family protein [Zopfochytrium polystomum]